MKFKKAVAALLSIAIMCAFPISDIGSVIAESANKIKQITVSDTYRDFIKLENSYLKNCQPIYVSAIRDGKYVPSKKAADGWGICDCDISTQFIIKESFVDRYDGNNAIFKNNFSVRFALDSGENNNLGMLYICGDKSQYNILKHYKIYCSDSMDTLFSEDSLIMDFVNAATSSEQYFAPKDGIAVNGRYYGFEVLDPCCAYVSGQTRPFAAFSEIAAFTVDSLTGTAFSDCGGYYKKAYGVIGPIPNGYKVATALESFAEEGQLKVFSKDGKLKTVSQKLSSGDVVQCQNGMDIPQSATVAVGGDLNCDGRSSATDIVKALDIVLTGRADSSLQIVAADTDDNGTLNVTDISKMCSDIVSGAEYKDTTVYKTVQKTADATDSTRQIGVDLNTVVNEKFDSFGMNCFPSTLSTVGRKKTGYNDVYKELDTKRLNSYSGNIARMWFQVAWMVTNNCKDRSNDITKNTDYKNYKNGIYSFDNNNMQAVYDYCDMLAAADTEVEVNFGWKTDMRIAQWFNGPIADSTSIRNGAPADLEAFAAAAAAFANEAIVKRGHTNIKYISFYNEPNAGDFEILVVDQKVYWTELVKLCYKAFTDKTKYPQLAKLVADGKFGIWAGELSAGLTNSTALDWLKYVHTTAADCCSLYSVHHYYDAGVSNNYVTLFNLLSKYVPVYKDIMITEMYGGNYSNSNNYRWNSWNDSETSFLIAASNAGARGVLRWSAVGGYLCYDEENFSDGNVLMLTEGESACWDIPRSSATVNNVKIAFYEASLFGNYIDRNSKVLYTNWVGDDVRSAAFLSPGGDITVVVEANGYNPKAIITKGEKIEKDISINFSDNKERKFYRFRYDPNNLDINANCTVISPDKEMTSKDGILTDKYDGNYSMYLYTTKKPRKQIELSEVIRNTVPGSTAKVTGRMIDCDPGDKIVYSISAYTGSEPGSISTDGIYTAPVMSRNGDMVAVRASLQSDPNVYAVAVVYIN